MWDGRRCVVVCADDEGSLCLQEMALQVENKLARLCIPSVTTPMQALYISLQQIKKRKNVDAALLEELLAAFPGVEDGLTTLSELGVFAGRPQWRLLENHSTEARRETPQFLAAVVEHFFDGVCEETKDNVLSVLKGVFWTLQHA
eukprot:TRINITY_DN2830_c0_g1_i2.p1 TRINITY_DN2830_c0_g1~~TRINITY_DN2830_c0_g1_i2.p1  ORF type:complete len:145 (+),score=22.43 TRINITY_DN2830_c0_g1_i2:252-686(+)